MRTDQDGPIHAPKMAAAMDVDTPSGTNSGAGKKRFEVKKVRPRRRAPPASGGTGGVGAGLMPASGTEKGATSRSLYGAGRPVPHRSGGWGGARPAGSPGVRPSQWLRRTAARAAGTGQSAGAAAGGGSRGADGAVPAGGCPGRASAARSPLTQPPRRASATPYPEPLGSSGRRTALERFRSPITTGRCGPAARAAPCAA